METIVLLVGWIAALATAVAADADRGQSAAEKRWRRLLEGPHVRRGTEPNIDLKRTIVATSEEASRISRHIANLANLESPDFGLSGTMGGTAFAPVAGTGRPSGGFLLTDHRLKTSEDFRQLVVLGPRAMPFLLKALDDKTPTKLKPNHDGILDFCTEMGGNPTNTIEQTAIASLPKRDMSYGHGRNITDYTITVGDVCFVIIGQIVGRAYLALRYQPTAIIVINSPVQEKALAKAVRDIWSSTNSAQRLFDSLKFDYATQGIFNGESLDGWGIASDLQCQAALRMLYYFPDETSGVIAARLAGLDVGGRKGGRTNFIHREVSNGVQAEEFIKAVAWSDHPSIRRELLNIFNRSTDPEILLAALSGIDASKSDLARQRINEMIDRLPADEPGPFGQGYSLLVALGTKLGSEAKPTFIRYLQNAGLQRWRSMARVLRETRGEWAAELLLPALADRREIGWSYALVPGENEPRRPMRVCDEAAETISVSNPNLPFKMEGEHENLDRQIAAIRERLAAHRP